MGHLFLFEVHRLSPAPCDVTTPVIVKSDCTMPDKRCLSQVLALPVFAIETNVAEITGASICASCLFSENVLMGVGSGKMLEAQFIPSFLNEVKLVAGDIMEDLCLSARPPDFHSLRDRRFSDAEIRAQITL